MTSHQSSHAAGPGLLIDDFAASDGVSLLGTSWRLVSDRVMGGVSEGRMAIRESAGRRALCLSGKVSLANNGGFLQVNLDLSPDGLLDASEFAGIRLLVRGNGEAYNLHLKTDATRLPWQSYRAAFAATDTWQEVRLPFDTFTPYRLDRPLDVRRLRRLAIVAIGKVMEADVCIAEVRLYRG
jgi:hypothetical protein